MLKQLYFRLSPGGRNRLHQVYGQGMVLLAWMISPWRLFQYYRNPERPRSLHLGCGTVHLPDWVNADVDPRADLVIDIRLRLPFPEENLEYIYSEHLLEHVRCDQGARFLREAHRVLRENGVLRVAMPDLDELVEGYRNDWRRFDWLSWPGHEFIGTRAEMLNVAFRWWGHKYLYNREELERRLREAGFREITFVENGQSVHEALQGLETRKDSCLIAEAVK